MKRNRWTFGLGTIGRDMVYALVNMYLIFYMTDVICVPTRILWHITFIIFAARIFDACNDPVMGLIVDNTKTKFGKFKPWIAFGAFTSGILAILKSAAALIRYFLPSCIFCGELLLQQTI